MQSVGATKTWPSLPDVLIQARAEGDHHALMPVAGAGVADSSPR
jgi:hypothetical protein